MPRPSGGYAAGYATPVPSANAAAGVWTPRDVYANRISGTWPVVGTATPAFSTVGYTRLWGLTTKSSGLVTGTAATDTGQYNVKWWDNTISNHLSGATFSKAAAGGYRAFEIYPVRQTITDSSSNAVLAYKYNDVVISSAQSKFGGASAYFDGTAAGGYLRTSIAFNYSSNFTIEFWIRRSGVGSNNPTLYEAGDIQSGQGGLHISYASNQVNVSNGITPGIVGGALTLDTWVHVALVRNSGTNTLYVNGTSVGTSTQNYGTTVTNNIISIGGAPNYGSYFNGYIDDFRQTQAAVYTANFTPPTAALTAIANTALLHNFNTAFVFTPTGQFDGFDVSSNEITKLRGESLTIDRGPGSNQWVQTWVGYPYYYNQWVQQWQPGPAEFASLKNNNLVAADLDQFYTDLGTCDAGVLNVQGNPGISADTPSIATAKGYTVFGSVPPATTLLLNCEGSNNGTTITDSSVIGHNIRRLGSPGPVTSTTQFIRGSSSVLFNGNNWLDNHIGNSANVLNTENFTIEMWVFLASRGAVTPIFELDLYTTGILWRVGSGSDSLWIKNNQYNWSPATHVPLSTWTHVALVRENDNVRVYAGGVQRLSATLPANTVIGTAGKIVIGASTHDSYATRMTANSYLDDIRLTRGLALYTGTFTPPTAQLTAL
jgi:hypothetical protein